MSRTAPIARFALAWCLGVAAGLLGVPAWVALLVGLVSVAAPVGASRRPILPARVLALVCVAGTLAGAGLRESDGPGPSSEARCAGPAVLEGRFLAPVIAGSAPFEGSGSGCARTSVVLGRRGEATALEDAVPPHLRAGVPVRVHGVWREGRARPWFLADSVTPAPAGHDTPAATVRWWPVRWRGGLVERIHLLFGERAALVTALTLARSEGIDPALRNDFAGSGIAHLLAISGFHVGVVAGLATALLTPLRLSRRRRSLAAAMLTAVYVALIGFPVSACRAALIFGIVAVSRALGRPPSRWGALGAAALVLSVLDPGAVAGVGFQLSFAGAAGLLAWAGPLTEWMQRWAARAATVSVPRTLVSAVAAGLAATLATAPLVAWHFGRVALVGIPATLVAGPLVSVALPAAMATVCVSFLSVPLGQILAGGTGVLLDGLVLVAERAADLPGGSAWVGRPTVVAGMVGAGLAAWSSRRPGIGGSGRRRLTMAWVIAGMISWPVLTGIEARGRLEVWMLDVGQGDAIAVRTPAGRWFLVDAGPPADGPVPAQPVVRALREAGAARLAFLLITHADADHFGGAAGVLEGLRVDAVYDPALPVAKADYSALLEVADQRGIPWHAARAGDRFVLDDVTIDVLAPTDSAVQAVRDEGVGGDANEASVVLLVSWAGVEILLTGDAYRAAEASFADRVGDVDVLKVGHHGSTTSTGAELVDATRPEWALVSVGRRNRYGHPDPLVVGRLEAAGARVLRTDEVGTIRMLVEPDGSIRLRR